MATHPQKAEDESALSPSPVDQIVNTVIVLVYIFTMLLLLKNSEGWLNSGSPIAGPNALNSALFDFCKLCTNILFV